MNMPTAFAPAERAVLDEIRRQYEKLASVPLLADVLDAVPQITLILNEQRQIVFANRSFAELVLRETGQPATAEGCPYATALGQRPGEALGCLRAHDAEGGCGTSPFCRTCGAVQAILNCQAGQEDVQECRMTRGCDEQHAEVLDLRVWARPLTVGGETFTIFSAQDISNEKRRQALERIFFHDVLNTASSVQGLAELLHQPNLTPEVLEEYVGMMEETSGELVEEIQSQRALAAAERGDLQVSVQAVHPEELLRGVAGRFRGWTAAQGQQIELRLEALLPEFRTDPVLLRRVLVNLTKNALEASGPGAVVTLGVQAHQGRLCFTVHNRAVMPPEVRMQIFSRSFSTKGDGRGLGTYSIKLITETYLKGAVTFVSDAQHGTCFTICFPLAGLEEVQ
jgi:signal transduction histidine kinase